MLDWGGTFPLQRCRHSLTIANDLAIVYGGYDGVSTIDAHHSLFVAPIDVGAAIETFDSAGVSSINRQEQWVADKPVVEADLPPEVLKKVAKSKLPLAMAKALHRFALAQTPPRDTYIDPATGYSVFTTAYLKRRPCCGNGCRHCPWGHVNVPEDCRRQCSQLDW